MAAGSISGCFGTLSDRFAQFWKVSSLRWPAICFATIGTGRWQPFERRDLLRRQLDAIKFDLLAMFVNATFAGMDIEVTARDLGFNNPSLAVDRFFEAAEPTTLAEIFPRRCCDVLFTQIRHTLSSHRRDRHSSHLHVQPHHHIQGRRHRCRRTWSVLRRRGACASQSLLRPHRHRR